MKQKPYILLILALQSMLLGGCTFMKYMKNYNKSINEKIEKGEVESFQDALHFGTDYAKQIVKQEEKQKLAEAFAKAQKNFESQSYARAMLSVNDAIDMANRNNDAEFLAKAFFLKAQIGKKYSFKVENGQFLYANDGVIKINLYHRLALSAAEASKDTLFMAKILRDSADTHLMRYALPTPEEFWQKGNFMTAFNALSKQRYAGYHAALDLYQKKDIFTYETLLDSMVNANIWDIASLNRLYKTSQKPEKKLLALWRTSYIYTQYIEHNNDFQYDMKHSRPLIDSIQKIHKTAYPLAEKQEDRNKQLQLMWRYVKTLEWQGNIEQALIENGKYAALCSDTLQWANTLYAELYGAKYRRDSMLEDLNMANFSFLNALHPQHGQPLDTVPQIALLDSMLQYWDCEQTLIYGKKLLAMKEKKYGIAYCYHVLMKLGDCEREAGNLDVAKRYYVKARNIYVVLNRTYVNENFAKKFESYNNLERPYFFLPISLQLHSNYNLYPNICIYPSEDTAMGYLDKPKPEHFIICHLSKKMRWNDDPIISNQKFLKETALKWDYIELSQCKEKDTLRWIKVLFDLLYIHTNHNVDRGQHITYANPDSILHYFKTLEILTKNKDTLKWKDLNYLLANASKIVMEDSIIRKYQLGYVNSNNILEEYAPGYKYVIFSKYCIRDKKPDSAFYYLKKSNFIHNAQKGKDNPYSGTNSSLCPEIASIFLDNGLYNNALQTLHYYSPGFPDTKYPLLAECHSKLGNIDSTVYYQHLLYQNLKNGGYLYQFGQDENWETYKRTLFLHECYSDTNLNGYAKENLFEQLMYLSNKSIKQALIAGDTLAAFNIAYKGLIMSCDNYKWEQAAKFADIARSFVEKEDIFKIQREEIYGNNFFSDFKTESEMDSFWRNLDKTFFYNNTHPEWLTPEMKFYEYVGLSYIRKAGEYNGNDVMFEDEFESNVTWEYYLRKSLKVAEKLDFKKEKINILFVIHKDERTYQYLKSIETWIREQQDTAFLELFLKNMVITIANIGGSAEEAVNYWREYNIITNMGDQISIPLPPLPNGAKYTPYYYWRDFRKSNDEDNKRNWRFSGHTTPPTDAISWAFQKYQTQIEQKTDSLNTAIQQATIQKNIAEKSTEIATQKTAEVAQKNAELAGASLLIQRKSDSVILQNTIIATNNQTLDSQNNELVIIKSSLEKTNQKITDQVVEVTRLKDNAVDREKVTKTYMQGSFAAASLFLIAFFAAFVFYRKSQKEKQQVEKQKTEITDKNKQLSRKNTEIQASNEIIQKREHELRHRIKNSLNRMNVRLENQLMGLEGDAYNQVELVRGRVAALEMLYQSFYQKRKDMEDEIDLSYYLQILLKAIGDSEDITISTELERVLFPVEKSEFFGLFVNEAVTNIFKHAFACVQERKIKVLLHFSDNSQVIFQISHNGNPVVETPKNKEQTGGMAFLEMMTKQLRGTFKVNGNDTVLTFSHLHNQIVA